MEQLSERKLTRQEFSFVERKLYDYPGNKQLIEDYYKRRDNIIQRTAHREKAMPSNKGVGKPVESTVTQLLLLERKAGLENFWVNAIDDTLELLSAEERKLVQLKYFEGYLTNDGIMLKLEMDRNRFYRMRAEIITKFAKRMALI